jgi:hypothetical protein
MTALAIRDDGFRLQTEGLAEPALDMLLSPEGRDLRQALITDLVRDPESASQRVDDLAPLLSSDSSLSGRVILDKLIAFLLSPEGEETRSQLAAGLSSNENGLDLSRVFELASMARKLHPEFRTSTLISALGGYLLSDEGRTARNQMVTAGAQWVLGGLTATLGYLARETPPPGQVAAITKSEQPS